MADGEAEIPKAGIMSILDTEEHFPKSPGLRSILIILRIVLSTNWTNAVIHLNNSPFISLMSSTFTKVDDISTIFCLFWKTPPKSA